MRDGESGDGEMKISYPCGCVLYHGLVLEVELCEAHKAVARGEAKEEDVGKHSGVLFKRVSVNLNEVDEHVPDTRRRRR